MTMLRRAQGAFVAVRDKAVVALRQARVIASDETGVRIEGSNAYHWVFRCSEAVVHLASPTQGAIVIRTLMDGRRPEVWCSDRYSAQQGHADAHQTCLAHLARDVAYADEASADVLPSRLKLWLHRPSPWRRGAQRLPPRPSPASAGPWSEVWTRSWPRRPPAIWPATFSTSSGAPAISF